MTADSLRFEGAEGNELIADRVGLAGQPVLMLHGGGQTRHSWDAAAESIAAQGHVVYVMDQRGHGESAWVSSQNYMFADFAKDLAVVAKTIREKDGAAPVVVGASLGGLAGMLAEGHLAPGSLAALVLVDITPRMDMSGVEKILGFMSAKVEEGFGSVEEAADAISLYLPNRKRPKDLSGLSKNLRLHADGRYRWHWDPNFLSAKNNQDAAARTQLQQEIIDAAANLKLPVLLVRGQNSELVSMEHVEEFLQLVPHAKFVDVQNAGHMVAGDRNDIFAAAVQDFLNDLFAVS
ncbi:pimeloyl-ACP methyl ester carboxylesterase [Roseibium hamelinense]|uniref:Pimeloyl-ACP methyl ester carboxylesterase n=1 Tax=Roseibium hamelinense TaxID=150831 RepID=A0A562TA15_9HYPH|nr:alpha/beta hydrolase [Roseibium hamelinense]MTI45110.1 alpha/beta hydrolase [Roseibium hamelinense]TWI90531.1 pimeloyl-ACP methyl ester carboxylesterase [Roseibium hamelinense]